MAEQASIKSHPREKPNIPLGFGELYAASGDHIAHFYSSRQEWRDVLLGFLGAGLTEGDKCVYFMKAGFESDNVHQALEDADVGIKDAIVTGQMMFHEGANDPQGMQTMLADALKQVPGKYPRLRWGGDMTWSLNKCSTEQLMTWETHCNGFERSPVVFLCQYELKSFSGSVVMDAMKTHPVCIVGNAIRRNPYYMEPARFLEELRSAT